MAIEDTTKRDPLLHYLGALDGMTNYITDMEATGQQQLLRSNMLPTDIDGDVTALGIQLGPVDPDDPLFREATLPTGWTKHACDTAQGLKIHDTLGRVRVRIHYKAAYYDRKASATVVSPADYAYQLLHGQATLVLDDEWATRDAMTAAFHDIRDQAADLRDRLAERDHNGNNAELIQGQVADIERCDQFLAQLATGDTNSDH